MAREWISYGKVPYLGSWDQNFPGIILIHSLSIVLLGPSDIAFRLIDVFIQVAACLIFYKLWSLYFRPRTAWIAVMVYVAFYVHSTSLVIGQRDVFAFIGVIIASWILLSTQKLSVGRLLLSGFLFGFASIIRPTNFLYEVAAIFLIPSVRNLRSTALLLMGCAMPAAIVIGFYFLIPHGLSELYLSIIRFNTDLYAHFRGGWDGFFKGLLRTLIVVIPVGLVLGLPQFARRTLALCSSKPFEKPVVNLYYSYVALTLALIIVQGKYLNYHFYPYVVLLTPIAAIGFEMVLGRIRESFQLPAFMLIIVLAALPINRLRDLPHTLGQEPTLLDAIYATEYDNPALGYAPTRRVREYLAPHVAAGERIEVAGFDARLRATLGANSATRFTMITAIACRLDTARHDEANFTAYQQRWRKEYMDSLRTVRPAYIVLARRTDYWYMGDPYDDVLHELPGFDDLLRSDYTYDTMIGYYQIFRRK
jgi:hypothetical protein